MSRHVVVRPAAEADLRHAATWYESRGHGLSDAFLDEVSKTVENILNRPESFPVDYRDTRRALVRRFPYAVHFVIRDEQIVILAVLHHRQDKNKGLSGRA